MQVNVNPYITFKGNAREALEFYAGVLGGTADIMTFGDYKMEGAPADGVMHGQIKVDGKIVLMASDTPFEGEVEHKGITISLSGLSDSAETLRSCWAKLSDGATVTAPMKKEVWGDEFGMLTDKYGVDWMVDIAGDQQTPAN